MRTKKYKEIFALIEAHRLQIEVEYGVSLQLDVKLNVVSLEVLEELINRVMAKYYPEYDGELGSNNRKPTLVMFRSIFFYFAREYGYTTSASGKHVGRDHATAIHGMKKLETKLSKNSVKYTTYFNLCKEAIENGK